MYPVLWTRTKPMQTTAWTGAEGWTQVLLGTSDAALRPDYGGNISEPGGRPSLCATSLLWNFTGYLPTWAFRWFMAPRTSGHRVKSKTLVR